MAINPQKLKKIKRIKRVRKWKRLSVIILSSFIFMTAFLLVLIYSSLGVKLATTVLEIVMPEVKIEKASGALTDLRLEGISMEMDGVNLSVGEFQLSLSGLCLIQGKVCVKNLATKNIVVNIKTEAMAIDHSEDTMVSESSSAKISMPIPLELRQFNITDVNVTVDDIELSLSSLQGSATWINDKVYLFPTTLMGLKANLPSSPKSDKIAKNEVKDDRSISEIINQNFNQSLIKSLPDVNLPLDMYVHNLKGDNWQFLIGDDKYQLNDITVQTILENSSVNAKLIKASLITPYANGKVNITGNVSFENEWPLLINLDASVIETESQQQIQMTTKVEGKVLGALNSHVQIVGTNRAEINAKFNLAEPDMPLDINIKSQNLQWPLFGQAQYQLKNMDVQLLGLMKDYQLTAKGDIDGNDLFPITFDIQAQGTNEAFNFEHITTIFPQGEFDASGKVDWSNNLKWDAKIDIKEVNLKDEIPNYPIELNGKLKTNGSLAVDSWSINLNEMALNGKINEVPLNAQGSISINSHQFISADNVNIYWGENQIDINGSTTQEDLIVDLNLSQLNVIMPSLAGNIVGQLQLHGTLEQPEIESNLTMNHFVWQDILLEKATLVSTLKYTHELSGKIQLNANQFEMGTMMIEDVEMLFSGSEQQHDLIVKQHGDLISSELSLQGNLNKERTLWKGELSDAMLAFDADNHWQINQHVKLNYDLVEGDFAVTNHCWINKQSKICLDKDIAIKKQGKAKFTLNNIELTHFDILNQGETKLAGTINGQVDINWNASHKIPTVSARLESDNVYVTQQIASQVLPIPLDLFSINVNLDDKKASLDWYFSLKELGRFKGNIEIEDPMDQKRLNGEMSIEQLSLAVINPLLDPNEHVKGAINSQLNFSGTLNDPYITGKFNLEHSEIKAMQFPADIQSMMIDINFQGKSSILKGEIKTKEGLINIDGQADWSNLQNWNAAMTVKGAAIETTISSMATLSVIPNISLQANQDQLDITGSINIPKANIVVESLPESVIDVSSDEVMLDADLNEIKSQNFGIKINSRVLVTLGNKVMIDAFGLKARLAGSVHVAQSNRGLTINGQIFIPEGRFRAYGQDLVVKKGEIFFAGPVDLPRLNIEAIRNPDSIENEVTAGIRVTGIADDPKLEVFSDPEMSQQEALSYLLRGQGLDGNEQSDNDIMTALLIGLGASQSGKILGEIGNTFGIKNLSLDTQGVGDSQKLVVSGYIFPNLQLKYGVGIFDSFATFTLRYRLLPRLYLEAASGLDQTVDLIYQFEL